MSDDIVEPVDRTHRDSVAAVAEIRRHVMHLRAQAARWEPRPYTVQVGR